MIHDIKVPVLLALPLYTLIKRQKLSLVDMLGILDADLPVLEIFLVLVLEQLLHKGIQRIVVVVVSHIVVEWNSQRS